MASNDSPKDLSRQERRQQKRDRARAQTQFSLSQPPAQAKGQQQRQRQNDLRRAIRGHDQPASPPQRDARQPATAAAASHNETETARANVRQGAGNIVELALEIIGHAQDVAKRYRDFIEHAKRKRCTIHPPQQQRQSETSSSSKPRSRPPIISTKDPTLLSDLENYISSASYLVDSWIQILNVLNASAFHLRSARRHSGRALADPTAARLEESYERLAPRVRESVAGMQEVVVMLREMEAGLKGGLRS
jgi:hypothetical protein